MLHIRLKKTGRKNRPSFRIVVADARAPRNGKTVEEIGWWNPSEEEKKVVIDKKRLKYWQKRGAKMSKAVTKLLQ